jgi:hypothetical protein
MSLINYWLIEQRTQHWDKRNILEVFELEKDVTSRLQENASSRKVYDGLCADKKQVHLWRIQVRADKPAQG